VLGIITGSYDTKNLLGVESKIYIGPMNKSRFVVGKRYAVVRETKGPVINKIDSKKLSQQLIQIIGEIEVESFGSEFVRAAIVSAYDMIERGDRIMDIPAVSMQDPPQTPPKQLVSKVLVGDSLDNDLFVEGQMLVLDKGFSNGMQLGYLFHVFDDTDPVLKEQSLIEPRSKGEVKIVHVSRYSSVGYIQKSREGIEVGDILLSHAELPNPVVPFTKSRPKVLIE
ncbi:hypothetical protein EBT16_08850, partial [bacterium]|nr:hypothetical protein [bacterium]